MNYGFVIEKIALEDCLYLKIKYRKFSISFNDCLKGICESNKSAASQTDDFYILGKEIL